MKKLVSLAMCLCLIISTFAVSTISAGAETFGDFDYIMLDNGTVSISNYNGNASELVIPSEIDGYVVTEISDFAFYTCESLKSVIIPNKVKIIGEQAFDYCQSLTKITIPDSVNHIGDYAFYECRSLTNITLPNNVNFIDSCAFKYTGYYNNKANWENDVLYIDDYLIEANPRVLDEYKIKDGTRLIANDAFLGCGLTSVTIPDSMKYIGDRAFEDCRSLKTVTIGSGVTNIGLFAFYSCPSLTSIKVDENNCKYCDVDGVLFNKSKTKLIQYPRKNKSESYTVPDSVITIDNSAFDSCSSLKNVTIPNSVKYIGEEAFDNCSSLKTITIGNSVTKIGQRAFYYCTSLTNINLPNSFKYIGYRAFSNCKALTKITIPDSVIRIGEQAFDNCRSLTKITIPNSVTRIGRSAFYKCTSLKGVTISNSVTSIGDWVFYKCTSLKDVTIPNSVTRIDYSAFSNCTKLTSVKIGNNVKRIEDHAFYNCKSLKNIKFGNNVKFIGRNAFDNCKSLKSVIIPNSVTKIGTEAFGYYYDSHTKYKKVKGFTVKGHKGSKAEKYAKVNSIKFVVAHNYIGKVTKPATYFANGEKVYKCSCGKIKKTVVINKLQLKTPKIGIKADEKAFIVKYTKVKDATGFEVKYKVGKKWTTKKFKTEKSVSKTISKLKKGSYKVQIRAFIQNGKKYAHSKAVTKSVNVK